MLHDCKSNMCNICTSSLLSGGGRCTGVPGAQNDAQKSGTTAGGNSKYNNAFVAIDQIPCNTSSGGMGQWDCQGNCLTTKEANPRIMETTPLSVDGTDFGNFPDLNTDPTGAKAYSNKFALQSLHKIWGDGGDKKYNNGVSSRNVYVSADKETVVASVSDAPVSLTQKVLVMEAHGDSYGGDVMGVEIVNTDTTKCKKGDKPSCPTYKNSSSKNRVGGIACTRNQYGPGVYNAKD